jgi:hypothetical protein
MQSRSFFTFGANFNVLVDPIYVIWPNNSNPAPISGYIVTEDNIDIAMENGVDLMITE